MTFLDSFGDYAETRFTVPTFSGDKLGEGQRWSTWTAITPSERGPEPWPEWVITSASAIDTELGIVKTGKEANVFLIERAVPGHPGAIIVAKRYRGAEVSDFHRGDQYREGRRMRNTRDSRAVSNGSSYGRGVVAVRWAYAEFEALCRMHALGVPVPYPVQVNGTELLMEFIGDGQVAAPRLAQVRGSASEMAGYLDQVVEVMHTLARDGVAHGDLSPYNLLVHDGRVIVIDLPQIVDVVANPSGMELLQRDVHNVCEWFARKGVVRDEDELFGELVAEVY